MCLDCWVYTMQMMQTVHVTIPIESPVVNNRMVGLTREYQISESLTLFLRLFFPVSGTLLTVRFDMTYLADEDVVPSVVDYRKLRRGL